MMRNAGAGIGGGSDGEGNDITISGGTVTATSGQGNADAIGGGGAASSNIQRTGGVITENGVITFDDSSASSGSSTTDSATTSSGSSITGTYKQWWIQSGAETGDGIIVKIGSINSTLLGIKDVNVTTEEGATKGITAAGLALDYISKVRSDIGAQQNRLEHTIANENNVVENLTATESRIRDTDMAEEMVVYSAAKIIAQVGEAMIAQANASKQQVLALLQ
jgi:flagellin-like hook-associated protein FlgL